MIKIGLTDFTPADKIIEIRDKKEVIKAKYAISATDILRCTLMNEHYIEISFQYNRYIAFKRSDYILWNGSKYTLREDYIPEQVNKRKYDYTLRFEAVEMLFQDIQYYYLNQSLKESEWRLAGNPEYFIKIAVDNANRYFKVTDFQIGVIEPTEVKDIIFDTNTNTFDALTQIAEDYESEWYMTGKTINLVKKVSFGAEVDFETEVSILSMSRSEGENSKKYTRILALGSERNLPKDYRGSSTGEGVDAVYPKRLRIPVAKGDVIDAYPNMSPDEVVEGTVIFDEVYPKRVGTIQAVGTIEYTDTDEDTGEVTKWNAFKIKDSGINFKEEYLLPGVELRLSMQSGDLNGFDFALKFHKDGFSSSDNSQYFEIVRSEDYGKKLPNDTMKPKAGDKYVLYGFNIALVSDQYVPAGELELFDTASAWLQKQLQDTSVYDCPTVIDHFKKNEMDLELGQKIKLIKDAGGNRNFLLNSSNYSSLWKRKGIGESITNEYYNESRVIELYSAWGGVGYVGKNIEEKPYIYSFYAKIKDIEANNAGYILVYGAKKQEWLIPIKQLTKEWKRYSVAITPNIADVNGIRLEPNIAVKDGNAICVCGFKLEEGSKATDWTPAPEDVDGMIRSSRIMGYEKKLVNKYDATYTVGDNSAYSRLAAIEKDLKEMQYAGVVYENTGSGGVYLIKQFDTTTPSDFNAYSAKASDAKYFNKQTGGGIQGDTLFQKNMQVQGSAISDVFQNSTFTAGQLGSGFQIKRDANGQSYMEVDNLMVRRETVFNKLTIAEIKSVGGSILLSLANMAVSKVEDKTSAWRCYFDNLDGTVPNDFAVNDQVICRKFTGKNIKYYWSKVTSVGVNFIEISKTDKDGTGVPAVADEVIQLGNRTDVNRQYAIMLSAYGADAPSIKQYAGINSYDLTGKEITAISPKGNKFTGSFTVSTNGTTAPVYKERQLFVNGTVYYLNDRVSYLGSYWVCIVESTITTPSETSVAWRKDTIGKTDINNAIENNDILSRNLLIGSTGYYSPYWSQKGTVTILDEQYKGSKIYKNSTARWAMCYVGSNLTDTKLYTLSFYAKVDKDVSTAGGQLVAYGMHNTPVAAHVNQFTTEWKKFSIRGRRNIEDKAGIRLELTATLTNSTSLYLCGFKLEESETATDWTPSIEDSLIEAEILQELANKAQADANQANKDIADIANDNLLIPAEKQSILKEWQIIQGEKPTVIAQAQTYSVPYTAYESSYNTLNAYITPLLVNMTANSVINGSDFRSNFKNYYDAKIALLKLVTDKAKQLADNAQSAAANAQNTANQAKTDATNAQTSANKAQTDANTANNLLTDIASDNKLTPTEKQDTKKEWDIIISEYPKNITQANKFIVSPAAYTTAYNALAAYINPLLTNLGTTSDINGTTFRNTFKAYYDARTDLLNAISVKAKELADNAQLAADKAQQEAEKVRTEYKADFVVLDTKIASKVSQTDFNALGQRVSTTESNIIQLSDRITSTVEKVDNIQIGSRNFLLNSSDYSSLWKRKTIGETITNEYYNGSKIVELRSAWGGIGYIGKNIEEKPYIYSFYAKINEADTTLDGNLICYGTTANPFVVPVKNLTEEWKRYSVIITPRFADTNGIRIEPSVVKAGKVISICGFKLEEGNKATAWTPAPEDVQAGIDNAQTSANNAQSTADSKNRSYYQDPVPAAPSGGHKVGDVWYKTSLVDSSGNVNADTSKNIYQLQYRWDGSVWRQINWSVSKSKIEQTDSSISMIVEKTGINSVGAGSTLYSLINQTADEIRLEVSSIQVGSRNLLLDSAKFGSPYWVSRANVTLLNEYYRECRIYRTANSWSAMTYRNYDNINLSKEHVFSFYVKSDIDLSSQSGNLFSYGIAQNQIIIPINKITTDWQRVSIKGIPTGDVNGIRAELNSFIPNGYVYFCGFKLEEGNKATDWTPAPEDVQSGIDKAQNTADSKTTIDEVKAGLVVTAEGINVFGETFTVNSSMIAEAIRAKSLNVGGNMTINQDGSINIANEKIKLNANGSGQLANGKIKWNTDGSGQLADSSISWDANGNTRIDASLFMPYVTVYLNNVVDFEVDPIKNPRVYVAPLTRSNSITLPTDTKYNGASVIIYNGATNSGIYLTVNINGNNNPFLFENNSKGTGESTGKYATIRQATFRRFDSILVNGVLRWIYYNAND